MDRGSTSAFQTEVVKAQNHPVHLVEFHFDAGTVYGCDAYKAISWGGNSYIAMGHLLGFSDIGEDSEVVVSSVTISLSGVDRTYISTLLNQDYIDRRVKIYFGFLDGSQQLVVDPELMFDGRMDSPSINEDPEAGTSTIGVTATNALVDFERITGRHTNHEDQQLYFPGDKGFEYAAASLRDLKWGSK